jgi:hypothetical protein
LHFHCSHSSVRHDKLRGLKWAAFANTVSALIWQNLTTVEVAGVTQSGEFSVPYSTILDDNYNTIIFAMMLKEKMAEFRIFTPWMQAQ